MRLGLRFFFSFSFLKRVSQFLWLWWFFRRSHAPKVFFFLPKLSLKIGFTALFTHLKIVLL